MELHPTHQNILKLYHITFALNSTLIVNWLAATIIHVPQLVYKIIHAGKIALKTRLFIKSALGQLKSLWGPFSTNSFSVLQILPE